MRRAQSDNLNRKKLLIVVFLLLSAVLGYQSLLTIINAREKVRVFESADDELQALRLENITLLLESEAVDDDEHLQAIARDRLNYSKDGETIFVISEDVIDSEELDLYLESLSDEISGVSNQEELSNSSQWVDFVIDGI